MSITPPLRHRSGSFAEYRGNVYRVFGDTSADRVKLALVEEDDPVPAGLEPDPAAPGRVFFASPEQLDAWYYTRWTFSWHGEPFDAEGSLGGRISGWYGGQQPGLLGDHLKRIEASAWLGAFPLDEVTDLTEHRTDKLAEWKEAHHP